MRSLIFGLLLVVQIFGQETKPIRPDTLPVNTRENVDKTASTYPVVDSDYNGTPPTRDFPPSERFNFPQDTGTIQTQFAPNDQQEQPQSLQGNRNNIGCTKDHNPLCGSDGKTYNNICEFTQAQSNTQTLTITRRGEC